MDKYQALIFLFTWLVDLLLLRAAANGDQSWIGRIRAAAAACIGGGYAVFALYRRDQDLILLVLPVMVAIAFGFRKDRWMNWGRFLFLWLVANAMAVGMADMNGWFLTLAAALLCLLILLGTNGGGGKEFVTVRFIHGGETVQLQALRDSGNMLLDPVSGENVLIVSPWVGSRLLGLSPREIMEPVETVASGKITGLRLIPYRAVGQAAGMLLAIRLSRVTVDGVERSRIVAFSPNPIGDGRRFEALVGGAV